MDLLKLLQMSADFLNAAQIYFLLKSKRLQKKYQNKILLNFGKMN